MKIYLSYLWLLLFLCVASQAQAVLKPGELAPDFTAQTLAGKAVKFSEFNGVLRLVELGTTWCPSCAEQAHQIDKLRNFLKKEKITTISIFLADPPASIREHLAKADIEASDHIWMDSGEARRNYNIYTIPRILFVDKKGNVIFDEMILTSTELKKRISSFLNP